MGQLPRSVHLFKVLPSLRCLFELYNIGIDSCLNGGEDPRQDFEVLHFPLMFLLYSSKALVRSSPSRILISSFSTKVILGSGFGIEP